MGEIIEASQLPEGDKVYLKKDIFGWRVVEPLKDPITGKYNYKNLILGSKRNLLILIIIFTIATLYYFGFKEIISQYQFPFDYPVQYCTQYVRNNIIW